MKKIKLFGIVGKVLSINIMCISSIILIIYLLLLLMGKPSSSTPSNLQPMPTITWSTPDTFTYDGAYHELTVSGYPARATVIYTGGQNNSNDARNVGTYTIKALITADGYIPWDGTHVLTINQATFDDVEMDNSTIPTNLKVGYSETTWFQALSSTPEVGSVYYTKKNVDPMLNGKFHILQPITIRGLYLQLDAGLLSGTYSYTIEVTAHKPGYADTTIDDVCSITIAPTNRIVLTDSTTYDIDTSGDFLTNRTNSGTFDFKDTSGVDHTLNRATIKEIYLDLPQITTAPDHYLRYLCNAMSNLTIADIKIPNTITSVGEGFCQSMFYGCSSLTTLANGFNLPQNVTTNTGINMFSRMFQGCASLTSLPSGFNLPQTLTSVSSTFCYLMFQGCSSLKNDSANLVTITIPNPSSRGASFCTNMFSGCDGLNSSSWSWYPTPTSGDTITINAN